MESTVNPHDEVYHELLRDIIENGEDTMDRTGTGTRSVFGRQLRFDLSKGFPAITTKQLAWKAIVGELLWFLEGSEDNKRLAELTHGDASKRTIWTPNANEPGKEGSPNRWLDNPNRQGDDHLGRVYGVQWRRWERVKFASNEYFDSVDHSDGSVTYFNAKVNVKRTDQVTNIVNSLKNNPKDRRMILTAFNVGELDEMALPPCHMMAQFHVSERKKALNCQVYIRSNDMFLGAPFNIASYALLTHMLANVVGLSVGELIITIGDAHIYTNHFDQVNEQLSRTPFVAPYLRIKNFKTSIDDFSMDDFELIGYQSHEPIKAPMAV